MFIFEMRQTWILIIISIPFVMALQSCSPHCDPWSWCFGFARKAFLSTNFSIINDHPWNETNLDTRNNLYSFCYWHYYHVLHIGMHDLGGLDLQEKLFFPLFSLQLMFIREMRQTWILIIISIIFVMALQSCSPCWDRRSWCFGFARKAFLSTIFITINGHPWNVTNLDTHNNLLFFLLWALQSCSLP